MACNFRKGVFDPPQKDESTLKIIPLEGALVYISLSLYQGRISMRLILNSKIGNSRNKLVNSKGI